MSAQLNFRSAFNGFNREDVVHYIEYMNARHTAELNQLNSELEYLKNKPEVPAQDPQTAELLAAAEQERDALKEQLAALDAQRAETEQSLHTDLEQTLAELRDRCAALEAERDAALAKAAEAAVHQERELEAYRRAERTERMAQERAEQLYRQANGILADATTQVDGTAAQIGETADRVMEQLDALRSAVAGSKQALQEAAAAMYAIRPESQT